MKTPDIVALVVLLVFFTLTGVYWGRVFVTTRRAGSKGWYGFPRGLTIVMSGLGVIAAIALAAFSILLLATG